MLFNSLEFIFLFLPLMLGLFYLTLRYKAYRLTLLILSLGSLVFYGYWSIKYLGLLLFSIAVNFLVSKKLERDKSKFILGLGVLFNLGILVYYKYFHFFLEVINSFHTIFTPQALILPLAISFYTFQQILYLFDSYRGDIKENKFLEYLFFVSFFPQLIAGPIVQHREIVPQLLWDKKYSVFLENCVIGLTIFTIGLIKKAVIADKMGSLATPVFNAVGLGAETATFFEAWGAALAYNLQVYFDFSGYSDMAIGLARMFGILLPQNFNSPFKSRSIIEFWQRWHMTLGRMINAYVFLPLSLFFTRFKLLKNKNLMVGFLTMIPTYFIVGFWHGAQWTFIIFGIVQGSLYFVNYLWRQLVSKKWNKKNTKGKDAISLFYWGITYLSLVVSFVIFRSTDMSCAASMYKSMIGGNGFLLTQKYHLALNYLFGLGDFLQNTCHWQFIEVPMLLRIGAAEIIWFVILLFIVLFLPNTQDIMSQFNPCLDDKQSLKKKSIVTITWQPTILYACLLSLALMLGYFYILVGKSEFLYFAF